MDGVVGQGHKLKRTGCASGLEPGALVGNISHLIDVGPIIGGGDGVLPKSAVDQPGGDRSRQVEHLRRPAVDRPGGQSDPAIPSEDRPFMKNC